MPSNDLAPGLLLAAPSLHDPNFEKTVVLLGRHDDDGALGWVINGREMAPVGDLLRSSNLLPTPVMAAPSAALSRQALVGGPVGSSTGWLLYRRQPQPLPGEMAVGPELGVTGEVGAFESIARGGGPSDFRLILGCAGWAPGQLEAEIAVGAWLPAPLDASLVMDVAPEAVWNEAYQRTISSGPGAFSSRRGSA